MLKYGFLTICSLIVAGCAGTPKTASALYECSLVIKPFIAASATGWDMKAGPQRQTILVNPHGKAFDIGCTQYPDIAQARLYKCVVTELRSEFLVLYVPPIASGGSTLTLFTILPEDVPLRAADITTHFESLDVGEDWRDALFVDSDGDGVLELLENDAYRWRGNKTYYSFDGRRFHPLWIDEYRAPEHDDYNMQFIARRKAK